MRACPPRAPPTGWREARLFLPGLLDPTPTKPKWVHLLGVGGNPNFFRLCLLGPEQVAGCLAEAVFSLPRARSGWGPDGDLVHVLVVRGLDVAGRPAGLP
jgi:hypothetical protein